MTALLCRCGATATVHCADCGAPICPQHTRTQGPLAALRETCGQCLRQVDGPVFAAPLPPAPVVTGTFTRDGKPPTQPWVKPKPERLIQPGVARVVEAPPVDARLLAKSRKHSVGRAPRATLNLDAPPQAASRPVLHVAETLKATGNPPKGAGMEVHLALLRQQAEIKRSRVEADIGWFKRWMQEAYDLVSGHRTLDALALLHALISLSRKLSPTEAPEEVEALLAARRAEHLGYLQAPRAQAGEG